MRIRAIIALSAMIVFVAGHARAYEMEILKTPFYAPTTLTLRCGSFQLGESGEIGGAATGIFEGWSGIVLFGADGKQLQWKRAEAAVLEKGRRNAGEFRFYGSEDYSSPVAAIRAVCYADNPEWVYVQVDVGTNSLGMIRIGFRHGISPYKGRMLSTLKRDIVVSPSEGQGIQELQPEERNAVCSWDTELSRLPGPKRGAFLVMDTNAVIKAAISYSPCPWLKVSLAPGSSRFRFAVSGFNGENAAAARKLFFEESFGVKQKLMGVNFDVFAGTDYDFRLAETRLKRMATYVKEQGQNEIKRLLGEMTRLKIAGQAVGPADWAGALYKLEDECVCLMKGLGPEMGTNAMKRFAEFSLPEYGFKPAQYPCPLVKKGPVLDGRLDDPCWQECPVTPFGSQMYTYTPPHQRTEMRMCYDAARWYIALELFDPEIRKLKVTIPKGRGFQDLWYDDCVEIHVTPSGQARTKWVINPAGAIVELYGMNAGAETATRMYDDRWVIETSVLWKGYGGNKAPAGEMWPMNILRYMWGSGQWQGDTLAPQMSEAVHWSDGSARFLAQDDKAELKEGKIIGRPDALLIQRAKQCLDDNVVVGVTEDKTGRAGLEKLKEELKALLAEFENPGRPGPYYQTKAGEIEERLVKIEDQIWRWRAAELLLAQRQKEKIE